MYTSPEDARSDLFMSVAVFLFGPLIFEVVFQYVPVLGVPVLGPIVYILVAVATTALVPYLLMRYRNEHFSWYGLTATRGWAFVAGAAAVLPLVGVTVAIILLVGDSPLVQLPALTLPSGALLVAVRLVTWCGTAFLAAYCTVKARDAFRSDPRTIRAGTIEIGRVVAIAMAVSALLLIIGGDDPDRGQAATVGVVPALLLPLGALGCVALTVRSVRGPSAASRAVLLTPTVILALSAFNLTLDGRRFFVTLWLTGIVACIGLVIGILQESRNSAMAALGAGVVVALLTGL